MLWIVEFETASPDDAIEVQETLQGVIQLFGSDIAIAKADVDGWIIRFDLEASDAAEALSFATIRTSAAAALIQLPKWPVVAMQVFDAEYASATCRGCESC